MQRIGLISDTHGFVDPLVYKYFEDCDEIWHAGDFGSVAVADELATFKPLKGVYGNIDGTKLRSMFPLDLKLSVDGLSVFITHIGGYPGRYEPRVRVILQEEHPQLMICGHSHILKIMRDKKINNMIVMNPGAAGNIGFHKMKTIVRFTIDKGRLKDVEAIELGKRGF